MNNLVPTRMFLTKGVGRHKYKLKSFEDALREAGVASKTWCRSPPFFLRNAEL